MDKCYELLPAVAGSGFKMEGYYVWCGSVIKDGDTYYLLYIGSPDGGTANRAIGYASSKSLSEGWVRSEEKLELPLDANNPAIIKTDDGRFLLYFRDGNLKVSVAVSNNFCGPYEVLNDNLFVYRIEDMFVYRDENGGYVMVAEDEAGKYTGITKAGVRFKSKDGINWDGESAELAYDFDVDYDDGSHIAMQRRERPFVLEDGNRKYLFTTAKTGGQDVLTGGETWNMLQEMEV